MAGDYISREAALKYIKSEQCKTCSDIGLCGNCAVLVAVKLLEKVPAADVAEVVHARWKRVRSNWYCTGCNKGYRITKGAQMASSFSCCPNCGAKMDGGEDCYGNDTGD